MFAQIIRGKVFDPAAVRPLVDRWMKEHGPTATGWLGSTSGITEDNRLFVLVRFESEEAARANSDRREQGEWWSEMEKLLDGEASFQNSNDVQVETPGDPDSAGFVQVMSGQVSDPERVRALMASQPDMRSLRGTARRDNFLHAAAYSGWTYSHEFTYTDCAAGDPA